MTGGEKTYMGVLPFMAARNGFAGFGSSGLPSAKKPRMPRQSSQDESLELRRQVEQLFKDRLARNLSFADRQAGNSPQSGPLMLRRTRGQTRGGVRTWSNEEREILVRMMGLFESGNPEFAARHDEIYGLRR